jgi:hypothetical protein
MRKLLSLILSILFIYGTIGYFPVFLLMKEKARKQMKEYIKLNPASAKLTVFDFDEEAFKNLEWENNDEFCYKDVMYDIIKIIKENNGKCRIYCINDVRETSLLASFVKQTEKNSADSTKNNKIISQFTLSDFLLTGEFAINLYECPFRLFTCPQMNHISCTKDTPSPPPKTA